MSIDVVYRNFLSLFYKYFKITQEDNDEFVIHISNKDLHEIDSWIHLKDVRLLIASFTGIEIMGVILIPLENFKFIRDIVDISGCNDTAIRNIFFLCYQTCIRILANLQTVPNEHQALMKLVNSGKSIADIKIKWST